MGLYDISLSEREKLREEGVRNLLWEGPAYTLEAIRTNNASSRTLQNGTHANEHLHTRSPPGACQSVSLSHTLTRGKDVPSLLCSVTVVIAHLLEQSAHKWEATIPEPGAAFLIALCYTAAPSGRCWLPSPPGLEALVWRALRRTRAEHPGGAHYIVKCQQLSFHLLKTHLVFLTLALFSLSM